jgi:hypothetical protein
MAKHTVYQISKSNRALASESVFYGITDAYTKAKARQAFIDGYYKKNADVEAESLQNVSNLINTNRTSPLILKTGPLRNISVGDLIYNHKTKQWFIVGPDRYDVIKIEQ